MMILARLVSVTSLVFFLLAPVGAQAASGAAAKAILERAVTGFVRPVYGSFLDSTIGLSKSMGSLCEAPSEEMLRDARGAFSRTALQWSKAELIRFGPVTKDNRLERILFWPDRKGTGLRQVQAALAAKDASATDPSELARKSVAMQGLGALEFVLFGSDAEELASGAPASYRCAYGRAIAANVQQIAAEIDSEWKETDGFARTWQDFGPHNRIYRTGKEALTELLEVFIDGLELIRDQRLGGFLAEQADHDRPKQALYWRSENTAPMLAAMMEGLKDLFDVSGLGSVLPDTEKWIVGSTDFEFNNAISAANAVAGPIEPALQNPELRGKLVYYGVVAASLSELFGTRLSRELGLTAGFSSLDGD